MTQTITIPNPPQSAADVIVCLSALGPALKVTVNTWEENPNWFPHTARTLKRIHALLNRAGYLAEDATGQPDETYGAGGTGKPGG